MRIGFIFPSSDYLFDPFRGDPFTHLHLLTILEEHFGQALDLQLIDLRGIKREFALYHIPECDAYLHSVYTLDHSEQTGIVKSLRQRYPRAKHLAGGPHVNIFPAESEQFFDSIILGEGEECLVQAVQDLQQQKLQTHYSQSGSIDINRYPIWSRRFMKASAVAKKGLMTLKNRSGFDQILGTTALFSRGCPYRCAFCAMPSFLKGARTIRYRHPELIEKEIEYLKKTYAVAGLNLMDEIGIPLDWPRAVKHLEAIGRTSIFWRGQCRVDGLTPNLANLASEAGCVALGLGVESIIQISLDFIGKGITIEQTRTAIDTLKKAGIETRLYLILGLPGEPEDVVEKTWSFIQETDPDLVYLSILTIRPGTELYDHPEKFGIKEIKQDWNKTMHMHGRYGEEEPTLTFSYAEETPWGPSLSPEKIVNNYVELQRRLREYGLSSAEAPKRPLKPTT